MTVRIATIERVFVVFLLAYLGYAIGSPGSTPATVLGFITLILGCAVAIRLMGRGTRKLLWRLRNRLIVAYFFIAVVPIVLSAALVELGTALLGGQLSTYLITSELERRTNSLRSSAEFLIRDREHRQSWFNSIAPYLRSRYPGLEIAVQDGGNWVYPAQSRLMVPDGVQDVSGLVVKEGMLFGWAHLRQDNRTTLAVFPITREYLGSLVPDVGESAVLDLSSKQGLLHDTLPDDKEPSRNRLPPALNWLDFEIRWGAPIPVSIWDKPRDSRMEWLTIRTRPSAILRALFPQKIDLANDLVYTSFFIVAILFLCAEIVALVIGLSLTRTITAAVHGLYEGTLRVTEGDFGHRIPLQGGDQLGELAASFNHMTGKMERLLLGEKERERLHAELAIAREVQNQLYPTAMPSTKCIRLTATCEPARIVSGDYYDYQQIDNNRVAIAISDVAGKGISAALLMATIQSSFRAQMRGSLQMAAAAGQQAGETKVSTSGIVSHLNAQLHADTSPEKYATFCLGVFDEMSSTLTYTNAGHLPPILVRGGEAVRLDVNGMVIGAFRQAAYDESRLKLESNDLLVFFTDGISEPENEYGEMFGEERLEDLVVKNAHLNDAAILQCITAAVREWTGASELQDDMTLLLVRRC